MLDHSPHARRPPRGERHEAARRRAAPSIVRLRLGCPDQGTYHARVGVRHLEHGVFIPSDRILPRPVGTRLHLKIELGDRTLAYSGGARVAAHFAGGPRPGYLLTLEPIEVEIEIPEPATPPMRASFRPAHGGGAPVALGRVALRAHR